VGYVIAAYGVTAVALSLYFLRLIRERNRLSSRSSGSERPEYNGG